MSGLNIHGPGSGPEAVGQTGSTDKTVPGASTTPPIAHEAGQDSSAAPAGLRTEPHAPPAAVAAASGAVKSETPAAETPAAQTSSPTSSLTVANLIKGDGAESVKFANMALKPGQFSLRLSSDGFIVVVRKVENDVKQTKVPLSSDIDALIKQCGGIDKFVEYKPQVAAPASGAVKTSTPAAETPATQTPSPTSSLTVANLIKGDGAQSVKFANMTLKPGQFSLRLSSDGFIVVVQKGEKDVKQTKASLSTNIDELVKQYGGIDKFVEYKPPVAAAVPAAAPKAVESAPLDATRTNKGVVRSYSKEEQEVVDFVGSFLHDYLTGTITQENEATARANKMPLMDQVLAKFGKRDGIEQLAQEAFLEAAATGLYVKRSQPEEGYRKSYIGYDFSTTTADTKKFKEFEDAVLHAFPKEFPNSKVTSEQLHEKVVNALANANARRTESFKDTGYLSKELKTLLDKPVIRALLQEKNITKFSEFPRKLMGTRTEFPDSALSDVSELSDDQIDEIVGVLSRYVRANIASQLTTQATAGTGGLFIGEEAEDKLALGPSAKLGMLLGQQISGTALHPDADIDAATKILTGKQPGSYLFRLSSDPNVAGVVSYVGVDGKVGHANILVKDARPNIQFKGEVIPSEITFDGLTILGSDGKPITPEVTIKGDRNVESKRPPSTIREIMGVYEKAGILTTPIPPNK